MGRKFKRGDRVQAKENGRVVVGAYAGRAGEHGIIDTHGDGSGGSGVVVKLKELRPAAPPSKPVGDHNGKQPGRTTAGNGKRRQPFRLQLSPDPAPPPATVTAGTTAGNGEDHTTAGNGASSRKKASRFTRPTDTPFKLPSLQNYFGSKASSGTYQQLINQIPPHQVYCEPCIGGGAIMRHKLPAKENYGYDADANVVEAWMREGPKWAHVLHDDVLKVLPHFFTKGTFIFLDPPYLVETLRSQRPQYREGFTTDQHIELLTMLKDAAPAMVMICALPNLWYENYLAGWRTFQFEQQTRHGSQTEQVWMNYPAPTELHDYRYIGKDYREREALRVHIQRRVQLESRRPILHRRALIRALQNSLP